MIVFCFGDVFDVSLCLLKVEWVGNFLCWKLFFFEF